VLGALAFAYETALLLALLRGGGVLPLPPATAATAAELLVFRAALPTLLAATALNFPLPQHRADKDALQQNMSIQTVHSTLQFASFAAPLAACAFPLPRTLLLPAMLLFALSWRAAPPPATSAAAMLGMQSGLADCFLVYLPTTLAVTGDLAALKLRAPHAVQMLFALLHLYICSQILASFLFTLRQKRLLGDAAFLRSMCALVASTSLLPLCAFVRRHPSLLAADFMYLRPLGPGLPRYLLPWLACCAAVAAGKFKPFKL